MKLWIPAVIGTFAAFPLLCGCGVSSVEQPNEPIVPVAPATIPIGHLQGNVYGGGIPISNAQIYLYQASSVGYGATTSGAALNRSISLLNDNGTSKAHADTISTDVTYGDSYVVTDANGNFNISGDYSCTPGTQLYLVSLGGNPGYGGVNSAAGLLTALPNCPSGGTLAGTGISFIYMNEVSTVAMAYAVAGFAHDVVHIGAPNNTLAQTGISNAFSNASNLYNFSGITPGHSAMASSTGIVRPQATVDTLANILQYCVNTFDRAPTPGIPTPTNQSPTLSNACTTLFSTTGAENVGTTTAGTSSTIATADTATAAIFIAQHPGRNTAGLYSYAITSATAYLPKLTAAPNDFSVQLLYSGGGMPSTYSSNGYYVAPKSLAIDAAGDAWVAGVNGSVVSAFGPSGVPLSSTGYSTSSNAISVAIDASGYAWVTAIGSVLVDTSKIYKLYATAAGEAAGTVAGAYASGGIEPTDAELDAAGNVWVTNFINASDSDYGNLVEISSAGTIVHTYDSTSTGNAGKPGSNELYKPGGVGIAPSGLVWVADASSVSAYTSIFTDEDASSGYFGTFTNAPLSGGIAFDASGDAWITEGTVYAAKVPASYNNAAEYPLATQHFTVVPEAIAADGNSNMWVTDFDNGTVDEVSNSGGIISPTHGYPVPGNTGYSGTPTIMYTVDSVAVDGSGNVWYSAASTSVNYLVEIIGIATPVATPIAYGLTNNKLGTRP